jgi:hypothetical protein
MVSLGRSEFGASSVTLISQFAFRVLLTFLPAVCGNGNRRGVQADAIDLAPRPVPSLRGLVLCQLPVHTQ